MERGSISLSVYISIFLHATPVPLSLSFSPCPHPSLSHLCALFSLPVFLLVFLPVLHPSLSLCLPPCPRLHQQLSCCSTGCSPGVPPHTIMAAGPGCFSIPPPVLTVTFRDGPRHSAACPGSAAEQLRQAGAAPQGFLFWAPRHKKEMKLLEGVQGGHEVSEGLE